MTTIDDSPCWCPYTHDASWIFPQRPEGSINQIVDFFQQFDCSTSENLRLRISADTDFVVWLNGNLVGYGQYSDFPDQKTHECFSLVESAHSGSNQLAITVFYNGRTSSVYRRGDAGLVFEVGSDDSPIAVSGTETLCRPSPSYHSGPIATVSGQLFYTFGYDARGEDAFNSGNYTPADDWTLIASNEATQPGDRSKLPPRPVERLVESGLTACKLASTGVFTRDESLAEKTFEGKVISRSTAGLHLENDKLVSPAWQMQHDYLSPRTSFQIFDKPRDIDIAALPEGLTIKPDICAEGEGVYLIIDMGQQEVGHLDFDLSAPEGTIIDFGYGEHLDDLRVRTWVGSRSFGARYICKEGRQQFIHHFQRWAGRYISLHIQSDTFTIYRVNLNRRNYPVTVKSSIETGNALHQQILTVAERTLHCCMHEHYEDTPWREQALYANDSRTQALCGYYAFGETAFPRSSFSLLGRSLRDDNFLCLTAPAHDGLTIPSFTFCWMLAVRDHFLYSGDDSLAKEFLPQITSMLEAFLAERKDGLLPLRRQQGIWHFYDWSGMSGYTDTDFDAGLEADAPLNCFLILALEAAQEILSWLGESRNPGFDQAIAEIRNAVADEFWEAEKGIFLTHKQAKLDTQLTQALAVLAGVGTTEQQASALQAMVDSEVGLMEPGLSQTVYTFSALMTRKDLFGHYVLDTIETTWGMMLKAGATTFWETIKGADDFHNAGSLCHAWSAVPVYIYYQHLLGVVPLKPGFEKVAIDPVKGYIPRCSGAVPVPGGEIKVEWQADGDTADYTVKAPSSVSIELLDTSGKLSRK